MALGKNAWRFAHWLAWAFVFASAPLLAAEDKPPADKSERVLATVRRDFGTALSLPDARAWDLSAAPDAAAVTELEVVGREWDVLQKRARIRLRCVPRAACAPFAVSIAVSKSQFESLPPVAPPAWHTPHAPRVVQPGEQATLTVNRASLRLTTVVTCLEGGALGDQIRVRRPDGRVLRGRVVGAGEVRILGEGESR